MSNDKVPNRDNWRFGDSNPLTFEDFNKDFLYPLYIQKTLLKTQRLFEYENLPETIPHRSLEFILQTYGFAIFTKVDGKYYIFFGGLGGIPNAYYQPTKAIVSNPFLKYFETLNIDDNCVVIRNDAFMMGLLPLIKRYAYLQSELDITVKFTALNLRHSFVFDAPDDIAKESAEAYINTIIDGKKPSVIKSVFGEESINITPNTIQPATVQHLIEMKQYIEGTFLQEIGIQSAFNMKREAINEAEATLSNDILFPLIDELLEERKIAIDAINKKYGLNIKVKISSVWAHTRTNRYLQEQVLANDANVNIDKNDDKTVEKEGVSSPDNTQVDVEDNNEKDNS